MSDSVDRQMFRNELRWSLTAQELARVQAEISDYRRENVATGRDARVRNVGLVVMLALAALFGPLSHGVLDHVLAGAIVLVVAANVWLVRLVRRRWSFDLIAEATLAASPDGLLLGARPAQHVRFDEIVRVRRSTLAFYVERRKAPTLVVPAAWLADRGEALWALFERRLISGRWLSRPDRYATIVPSR